jgi:predicted nucleic acid-binding protein
MNVIDSSVWLEYFADTSEAVNFIQVIEDSENLIVPVITIYEVFKKINQERNENDALLIIAHMQQGKVINIDSSISILAAKLSIENKLPMADSLILATAKKFNAILWTQDSHFENITGVKYFSK